MAQNENEDIAYQEVNNDIYSLRLYITGMTPNCRKAVENIKTICEKYLLENYELEIIDMYQEPELTIEHQILASPTLVRLRPLPVKKLLGNLSDFDKVITVLNLKK
ncbi:MAG: circadian clock protein KaiB [Opitutaceae bacterium]|nr:circadian clock protein KaiB [Cytophagales bacterium]